MKLGLGTVQFGIDYGITNHLGVTSGNEVSRILDYGKGIFHILDTAPSYGNSEEILGLNNLEYYSIVTKTPYIKDEIIAPNEISIIENTFFQSLKKLKQHSIYGISIHNPYDLYKKGAEGLFEKLLEIKKQGYVNKIGISFYDQRDIDVLCDKYPFDVVQVPINVLDQRLIKSGTLIKLKKKNIEIHARSIFLQGILLNEVETLNGKFKELRSLLTSYYLALKQNDLTKIEGALSFVNTIKEVDYAIVGVNHLMQLKQINEAYNKISTLDNCLIDFEKFSYEDEDIIDPRRW